MSIIPTNPLKRQRTTTPWQMYASDQYARFPVLSTAPVGPSEGWLYFDDGTNTANGNAGLRKYDGTAWVDVGGIENGVLTVTSLITGNINFDVLGSAPTPAAAGMLYVDDGSNTAGGDVRMRLYNGTAWNDVGLRQTNGTWTPVFTPGSGTLPLTLNRSGYVRTGNLVTIWMYVIIGTATGPPSGTLVISGLPYAAANNFPGTGAFTQAPMVVQGQNNADTLLLYARLTENLNTVSVVTLTLANPSVVGTGTAADQLNTGSVCLYQGQYLTDEAFV